MRPTSSVGVATESGIPLTTATVGRLPPLAPYGVAAGASLVVWLLSQLLAPLIEPGELPLFLGAVMLSGWYGGLGPALLSTLLGAVAGAAALMAFSVDGTITPTIVAEVGVFVVEALVISLLTAALRRAQHRAETLVASERAARADAETAAARWRSLQRVTDAALADLELDDLLRELIERIREVLATDTVVILLITADGRQVAVRATHGLEQEVIQGIQIPVGQGVAGRIAAQHGPIIFDDLTQVEISSPVLRAKGLRALLGVPLIVEGRTFGVVHVGTLSVRRFTPDDAQLLQLVADRIGPAIDRARLHEAERAAREAAETAERRFRLLVEGVPDYATYALDRDGRIMSWNAGAERLKGYPEAEVLGRHVALFYTDEDARRDAPARALEMAAARGRHESEMWRARQDGTRFWAEVVVTALRDAEGRLSGYTVITHDLTERKRAAEVRARLLDQIMSAQEEEQRRIARELHDETGQSLTSLLVGLRALQDAPDLAGARAGVADLRRITLRTLDEVRRLARGLRPSALDELGLVPALEHQALEYTQARGITVDVQARGLDAGRLPPPVETALYRIVQEALTNVAKHAAARSVSIVVQRQPTWVQVTVSDDGCGFDVATALRAPGGGTHLGLHGMRERAALLDGSVTIESVPVEGTTIYVRVPLSVARSSPAAAETES